MVSEGTVGASATRHHGVARALVRAVRPRQWVKNLLVVAAPLAAGKVGDGDVIAATLLALVSFCLAASAVYLVNDTADREVDRLHPTKRLRPIASGALAVPVALTVAGVLATAAVAVGWVADPMLAVLVASYLLLQVLYAVRLKHEPVLDISVVAAGFLMRAVAGGIAADLPLSQWFLLVSGFGSLFIVAGKRYSELHTLGSEVGHPAQPGPLHRHLPAVRLEHRCRRHRHLLQPVGVRAGTRHRRPVAHDLDRAVPDRDAALRRRRGRRHRRRAGGHRVPRPGAPADRRRLAGHGLPGVLSS